jgi:hypothetical protein
MFSLDISLEFESIIFLNACMPCCRISDYCNVFEMETENEELTYTAIFQYLSFTGWVYAVYPIFYMGTLIIVKGKDTVENKRKAIEIANTPTSPWAFWSYNAAVQGLIGGGDIVKNNSTVKIKNTPIFWWETWSYYIIAQNPMENKLNSTWNNYRKYRLSIWNNWHILEDRILIFLLIFLTFIA